MSEEKALELRIKKRQHKDTMKGSHPEENEWTKMKPQEKSVLLLPLMFDI